MAKYSPIGPIAILQLLQNGLALGDYLLLLAHDVLAHQEEYKSLIDAQRTRYKDLFIIMDNGTIELGKPVPAVDVIKAAQLVVANCVCLPDVVMDLEATQELITRDLSVFMHADIPIMKIVQGKDTHELIECVDWLHSDIDVVGSIDYWAVPRWITNEEGSRKPIIQYINAITHYDCKIHLLGMSENLNNDIGSTMLENVMGIDSANPIVFGQDKRRIGHDIYIHMERGDYWEHTNAHPAVYDNVDFIRRQIER